MRVVYNDGMINSLIAAVNADNCPYCLDHECNSKAHKAVKCHRGDVKIAYQLYVDGPVIVAARNEAARIKLREDKRASKARAAITNANLAVAAAVRKAAITSVFTDANQWIKQVNIS